MQIEMINANGSVWIVKRKFKADSWFTKAIETFGGEAICKEYCVEKVLRMSDGTHLLVNEVPEAEIIKDEIQPE
jgi:hypothetical protein